MVFVATLDLRALVSAVRNPGHNPHSMGYIQTGAGDTDRALRRPLLTSARADPDTRLKVVRTTLGIYTPYSIHMFLNLNEVYDVWGRTRPSCPSS